MQKGTLLYITAILLFAIAIPLIAYADCADPVMPTGAIIYNSDHAVMQYCREDTWMRLDGIGIECLEGDGVVMSSTGWECSPGGPP